LQKQKTVAKTTCDCDCKKVKKTVAKTQVKKVRLQKKTVQKKAPCHDTVRLRIGWCLLDVVATL
jgi:hypothetical protein